MITNSRGAKKAGLKGELGVAPAVIVAIGKAFGVVIKFFKKLKLKKKDGSIKKEISTIYNVLDDLLGYLDIAGQITKDLTPKVN